MMRALSAIMLVACVRSNDTPSPPVTPFDELPPPSPIVQATPEDERACARLAALGCPEAARCLGVMSVARTDRIQVPSACLAAAVDVAAVRRCGDTGTLTFGCAR